MIKNFKYLILILLVSYSPVMAKEYSFNINNNITLTSLDTIISTVTAANNTDTINLNITSNGGKTLSAARLCKAMHNSAAKYIVAHVKKYAKSAGADIASCTDKIILEDNDILLYHLGSIPFKSGRVTISIDMDQSLLINKEYNLTKYYHAIIGETETITSELGLPKELIYESLHGEDGLIIDGRTFKIYNPNGIALRHSDALYRSIVEVINSL